jgi:ketosteroid isomerase-like protein
MFPQSTLLEGMRMSDDAVIRALNAAYIEAYMAGDTGWYERNLTDDFVSTGPDGAEIDRRRFLERIAAGPDIVEYRLERVRVRVDGDAAIVDAAGTYVAADGHTGLNRYTDIYRRAGGEWRVCSAMSVRIPRQSPASMSASAKAAHQ